MQKLYLFVVLTSLSPHGAWAADLPRQAPAPVKAQIGTLFGANNFWQTGEAKPSAGGEFVLGLPHNLAAYGDGWWNRVWKFRVVDLDGSWESQGIDARTASALVNLYDLGGGLQWSIPNRTRIVPYFRAGLSWLHLTAIANVGGHSWDVNGNRLAGTFGGGIRVYASRNFGVITDLRVFHRTDIPSMVRVSGGLFYQFK
jgi:hypothetical protein